MHWDGFLTTVIAGLGRSRSEVSRKQKFKDEKSDTLMYNDGKERQNAVEFNALVIVKNSR